MSEHYKNRIYERRTALGLSQRELAKAAGTSQQQIQRIEAGVQAVKLELAARIAAVLKSSIADVFPKVGQELSKKRGAEKKSTEPRLSAEALAKAGIDADPATWTVRIGFEGDLELDFVVSSEDKERVSSIIWNSTFDFIVFDTSTKRVAVNRSKINYANFLFDIGRVSETNDDHESYKISARFIGNKEAIEFGVDPDTSRSDDDDEGFSSQLQNLFLYIDGTDADEDEILWLDDEDGERVFLRKKQLVVLEVPLLCCEPTLWNSFLENYERDQAGGEEIVEPKGESK